MIELENIKSKLSGLINDLKWKPQNPAYVITKDDVLDALSEALDYVDRVSCEEMYDNTELKKIISDAYFDIDNVDTDVYSIKNDLKQIRQDILSIDNFLKNDLMELLKSRAVEDYIEDEDIELDTCINDIDGVISELEDIFYKIRDIKYDLDY